MKQTILETDLLSFPMELETPADTFIRSEKQNRIILKVFRGGVPFALSGTPSVLFMKPDQTSIEISQNVSISGNQLIFNLPDVCYAQNGRIAIALLLANENERTTLGVCRGTVYPTRS